MVHLYGVMHGGCVTSISGSREFEVLPTQGLVSDLLNRFPIGTRIGIEDLSKQDWADVVWHLSNLPFNPPEPRFIDDEPQDSPRYKLSGHDYWGTLEELCSGLGFEVVFLEDKAAWFKYNELIVKRAENAAVRKNLLVREDGENKEHYDRKRISFNLEKHKEDILIKKIHEIERDDKLIENIKSSEVDVALVGLGHSDYWIANSQKVQEGIGLEFESYSTEVFTKEDKFFAKQIFVNNANPDLRRVFNRNSLERSIRLLETGRFSDRKPDLVGTWDISNPSQGYFEMFMDRANGKLVSGMVFDCLGDARFEGELYKREIRFVKKYLPDSCSEEASPSEIVYKGIVRNQEIIGWFVIGGCGERFYATSNHVDNFLGLAMDGYSSARRYTRGLESLSKRLFK